MENEDKIVRLNIAIGVSILLDIYLFLLICSNYFINYEYAGFFHNVFVSFSIPVLILDYLSTLLLFSIANIFLGIVIVILALKEKRLKRVAIFILVSSVVLLLLGFFPYVAMIGFVG